jgi:hypothetical protein
MKYAFVRTSALTATLFALGTSLALAQQSAPFSLDPNLLTPAPGFEKPTAASPQDEKDSKLTLPDHIDLGTSQLRFDTDRNDPIPRVGIDQVDPSLVDPRLPAEKSSPLKPKYFGFTLSTPTH